MNEQDAVTKGGADFRGTDKWMAVYAGVGMWEGRKGYAVGSPDIIPGGYLGSKTSLSNKYVAGMNT